MRLFRLVGCLTQLPLFSIALPPDLAHFSPDRSHVRPISYETTRSFVCEHHYKHAIGSSIITLGMYIDDLLIGVCVYGIPPQCNVTLLCGEAYANRALELNRLVLLNEVGSWFIAQTFKILEKTRYCILVSYADEGEGHLGVVYQATNWLYTGVSKEAMTPYDSNGRPLHRRTIIGQYGTSSRKSLTQFSWNLSSQKHRYVYFLGTRSQKKLLRALLKWPVLPYPKNEGEHTP